MTTMPPTLPPLTTRVLIPLLVFLLHSPLLALGIDLAPQRGGQIDDLPEPGQVSSRRDHQEGVAMKRA